MPTRIEIIAQIDSEISRLERARDYLVAALAESENISTKKARTKIPARTRKQAAAAPAAALPLAAAAPLPPPKQEPEVHRVPPKRRMERRQLTTEKAPAAALRGLVPVGPVVVSANEARKVQERTAPPPPPPAPIEAAVIGAERSLGSLIQAFERRAGLNGIEIP
jgi:hypothetical protein